jgi:hypothetical protein
VPLLLLLAAGLFLLARATQRAWRDDGERSPWRRAAACGLWLVLVHSLVDYPLRTTAIATVVAVLFAATFVPPTRQRPSSHGTRRSSSPSPESPHRIEPAEADAAVESRATPMALSDDWSGTPHVPR